jgi:L-threonylcarbamoyladenylate synthase
MNEDIKQAIETLRKGGIILYPTDTIWGLGCDATNEEAVRKIYKLKHREDSKSMLCLTDNPNRIQAYINEMPSIAWDLIELSEKPLTIIYPEAKNLAANLIAEDKSIGIRVTTEEFSKRLCEQFRKPIVSTSANISGEASPTNYSEISEEIKTAVDYIVKHRQNDTAKSSPSSIIKLDKNNIITIIRK